MNAGPTRHDGAPSASEAHQRVAKASRTIAALTVAARIVGFVRWVVFAAAVGAAGVGSVYQSVNAIPNLVYEIAAGGLLSAIVIPLIARVRHDSAARDRVIGALLTRSTLLLGGAAIAIAALAPQLTELLLGDSATTEHRHAGTILLLMFAPQVVFYGMGIISTGVLQAHERFVAPAIAPLLSSLVVIATYLVYAWATPGGSSTAGLLVLGLGTTFGVVALASPQLWQLWRLGVRPQVAWQLPGLLRTRTRELVQAGIIVLVGQQLALLSWLLFANREGGSGAVAVLGYAQAVYLLPYAVLCVPVATAVFPSLTLKEEETEPRDDQRTLLGSALGRVISLSGVSAIALALTAPQIQVVFTELDVTAPAASSLGTLASALTAFAPGLVGFSIIALLTRALYAHGQALQGAGAVLIGWALAAFLPWFVSFGGALSTLGWSWSIGMSVGAALLVGTSAHSWPQVLQIQLAPLFGLLALSAAVGLLARIGSDALLDGWLSGWVLAVCVGAIVGGLTLACAWLVRWSPARARVVAAPSAPGDPQVRR